MRRLNQQRQQRVRAICLMPLLLLEKGVNYKKQGGHQQSLPGCAEKGEAARQQPKPPVGSGFDVDSDNSKPETIPPLNLDCPF